MSADETFRDTRSLLKKASLRKICHPELVEGSVRLSFTFTEAELILRQAQDDCLFGQPARYDLKF
jgi:hypothetical protein